jgi:2-polyprenyl-3-methyl-5-hydroxy-6-metoxy-1,4-benzoquinol methylase
MDIEEYSRFTHFYTNEIPDLLQRSLDINRWASFLDVGCGDGALIYALDRRGYFKFKTVYAIDLSQKRIEAAEKVNSTFKFFCDDACNMRNIRDATIDFLVANQVIEHVRDDEMMIKEIGRVLVKHGTVYLSTVFRKPYGWYFYRCNGKWVLDPTHLREYEEDAQLLGKFLEYDFRILENVKSIVKFPLLDFVLREIHSKRTVFENRLLRLLRKVVIPIPGYYKWEILLRKD